MHNEGRRCIAAIAIASAVTALDAAGSPSQAGPCFKFIDGQLVYVCPLPKPPLPQLLAISVAAGPTSGMGTYAADNIYVTASQGGKKLTAPGLVVGDCKSYATGSSLPSGSSPWITGCLVNADYRIPCAQSGELSVTFTRSNSLTPLSSALSNTATIFRNCNAWNSPTFRIPPK